MSIRRSISSLLEEAIFFVENEKNLTNQVFSTFQEGEEIILRNSGEYYGCLVTKAEYENYHFQLKYKWGKEKWAYRKNLLMDSGILYHSIGPAGVEHWRSWMLSQEFQIMEGHTGDFWSQANSAMDVRAYKPEGNLDPVTHASQEYLHISMHSPYKNHFMLIVNDIETIGDKLKEEGYELENEHYARDKYTFFVGPNGEIIGLSAW